MPILRLAEFKVSGFKFQVFQERTHLCVRPAGILACVAIGNLANLRAGCSRTARRMRALPDFAFLVSPCYPPAISKTIPKTDRHVNTESKSRVVYENLDTTFVNLWALLRSLSQRSFIGRIRVELKDYTADVFMSGSSTPLVREIDHAAGTDTLEEGALHRLVLRAREAPGTISVFAGADGAVAVKSTPSSTTGPEARSETEIEATGNSADEPIQTPEIEAPSTLFDVPPLTELPAADSGEAELPLSHSAPATAPVIEPTPMDKAEWDAIVKATGELIGGVERALTSVDADFDSLFRTARIELADDYTFLDPMSDGLEYENAVVTLGAELPSDSYVAGLSEALRRVVDKVATGERARRVRERVALELCSVARKRNEILTRSGFRAQLDRIAGTKVI